MGRRGRGEGDGYIMVVVVVGVCVGGRVVGKRSYLCGKIMAVGTSSTIGCSHPEDNMASIQQGWLLGRWFCFLKTNCLQHTTQGTCTALLTHCCVNLKKPCGGVFEMQPPAPGSWLWNGAEVSPVLRSPMWGLPFLCFHSGDLLCKSSSNSNVKHLGVLP